MDTFTASLSLSHTRTQIEDGFSEDIAVQFARRIQTHGNRSDPPQEHDYQLSAECELVCPFVVKTEEALFKKDICAFAFLMIHFLAITVEVFRK